MSPHSGSNKPSDGGNSALPYVVLLVGQCITSSWHVLGKHVFTQVPYLAPISYTMIRTLISSVFLLIVGNIKEGHVQFPPLLLCRSSKKSPGSGAVSIESGNSIGSTLSQSDHLTNNINYEVADVLFNAMDKKIEEEQISPLPSPKRHHGRHHRPRRKKGTRRTSKNSVPIIIQSIFQTLWLALQNIQFAFKNLLDNMNPDAMQVICMGLSGMLILPVCYTTGLLLTSPTVASVWDGPMIPLGCFCSTITLGVEKRSRSHPFGQIGSLLLTVAGSICVLLVDYAGGGHGMKVDDEVRDAGESDGIDEHLQFVRGNMVLTGLVIAYSAMALLQKRLSHYPPIQLTGWSFGCGFLGCLTALLLDSIFFGGRLTGCTLRQAMMQIYMALTTSPTFRYGLLYAAIFVGGGCYSIMSYASAHLESSVITLFAATQPPITAVLEWIWEGKDFGAGKLAGMVFIGIGMHTFTYIKRLDAGHNKKRISSSNKQSWKMPKAYENGNSGMPQCNGETTAPPLNGAANLTNRKAHEHADV